MTQGELTHGEAPDMYPNHPAVGLYLQLLQSCLTGELDPESFIRLHPGKGGLLQTMKRASVLLLQSLLRPLRLELVRRAQYDPSTRREGKDWPAQAETRSVANVSINFSAVLKRFCVSIFLVISSNAGCGVVE